MKKSLAMFLPGLLLAAAAHAQTLTGGIRTPAAGELAALRVAVHDARVGGNLNAYLAAAQRLHRFLNGSPRATLQLMVAQEAAGRRREALDSLAAFVRMGQSDPDALDTEALAGLHRDPAVAALLGGMERNAESRTAASPLLRFAIAELVPEDIDHDPVTDHFFVSTVLGREILSIGRDGKAGTFTRDASAPFMALRVDAPRRRLWATQVAVGEGRSTVLVYSLKDGKRVRVVQAPPGAELGDMTLDRSGNAYFSDGSGGGVYRMAADGESLQRLDAGEFISPQTPAPAPDGTHLWVPDYLRGIALMDLATGKAHWLQARGRYALSGIDGLYLVGQSLIATQNGTSPERVVRFRLDAAGLQIVSEEILERGTATLGAPTHGVVVGDGFYYLANSGWEALDEHAQRRADVDMTPAILMRAPLRR